MTSIGRLISLTQPAGSLRLDPVDYSTWIADEDMRLITERLVEIIGEAARAMTPEARAAHPDIDRVGLIGLRNVLVHAYHRIQPDLLWQAATVDIPIIARRLRGHDGCSDAPVPGPAANER